MRDRNNIYSEYKIISEKKNVKNKLKISKHIYLKLRL